MKSRQLLILGAGQYGFVANETAQAMDCFDRIDFLDDRSELAVGKLTDYEKLYGEYTCAFVAIGNPELRWKLLKDLERCGYTIPVLVHPQATVMPSARVADGSIIEAHGVVNSNAVIGTGCIISAGAVVNHNSCLGNVCHVDCNATVPARCSLPDGTKVLCGTVYEEI